MIRVLPRLFGNLPLALFRISKTGFHFLGTMLKSTTGEQYPSILDFST